MLTYTKTIQPRGLEGQEIRVEVDSSKSLPTIEIIGLPDSAIKESKERLRATFRHCNIEIPPRKFIINLAPSHRKKSGTMFDVAIATALFLHIIRERNIKNERWKEIQNRALFFGELGLDGGVQGMQEVFAGVMSGIKAGYTVFFVPQENVKDLIDVSGISLFGVAHFSELIEYVLGDANSITEIIGGRGEGGEDMVEGEDMVGVTRQNKNGHSTYQNAWDEIQGHSFAKRALAIAATGRHNVLMVGTPGTGKSMLAKALQSLLPPLEFTEVLEVSHIYSLHQGGNLTTGLIRERPFRTIHHTTSKIALTGGGQRLVPGELSLAHKGVLFFDEVAEFSRDILDSLRQPLEDKTIWISRAHGKVQYPTNCMFVGAMNPCICGYYGDTTKMCQCSLSSIKRYQQRISGPLLDRMDMILPFHKNAITDGGKGEMRYDIIKEQVNNAWLIQKKRYEGSIYTCNADVQPRDFERYMSLDKTSRSTLDVASKKLSLSMRVIHKTIRVARSIADFGGEKEILQKHILEALQYRNFGWMIKE